MALGLQRAKTAREAIKVMTDLVARYGYSSEGESFSIADPNEVWIMEMIGKGDEKKGAVWVAVRIPDDCISAHANQSRIHKFNLKDKQNVMYAKDVIKFARQKAISTEKMPISLSLRPTLLPTSVASVSAMHALGRSSTILWMVWTNMWTLWTANTLALAR